MKTEEIIKEVKFNMSTIGLNEKAKERVSKARTLAVHRIEAYATYASLGTVEELEKLKIKATPVKLDKVVTEEKTLYKCPNCKTVLAEQYSTVKRGHIAKFCETCGQALSAEGGI